MLRLSGLLVLVSLLTFVGAAERGFVPMRRAAGDHVALVIGNGAYPDVPLANPVNDAVDVAKAFESIGFQVQLTTDADKAQMLQAISQFGDRLAQAKAAVFYYAGHGVQVEGSNWLMPVARQVGEIINREDEVRLRAVDAGEVLLRMERAKVPVSMVILDACRNNPFKGAGRSGVKGLAQLNAPPGSIVVYATAPGSVAADGQGRNSPFTQAFLAQVTVPGQPVDAMLMQVRRGVRESTQGVQVPWSMTSMTDTFTFVPAISPDEEREMKQTQLAGLTQQAEAIAKAEAAAAEKRTVEEAALAAKQAEVDKLNAQIEAMRKKVNSSDTSGAQTGDGGGLKAMLAVVRQKEAQQKELVEMQRKAEAARQAREAEIARMKAVETQENRSREQKRLEALAADLKDYREIAGSYFGKDMAQSAWDEVLRKWGMAAGGIRRDDVAALESQVAPVIGVERAAVAAAAWASERGMDEFGIYAKLVVGSQTQVMRLIPAGNFRMSFESLNLVDEEVRVQVTISKPFWCGDSEVTQGLWREVMGETPSHFTGDANRPVEQVSWDDCQEFLKKLNGQVRGLRAALPTEAQWEYACRAGTTGDYAGDLDAMAWFGDNSGRQTHPVKAKLGNIWGLYDMSGNVWEWCADWYAKSYASKSQLDPTGALAGPGFVFRGGSWGSVGGYCRSSYRVWHSREKREADIGLRLAAQAVP